MNKPRVRRTIWWAIASALVITVLALVFYKPKPDQDVLGLVASIVSYSDDDIDLVYLNDMEATRADYYRGRMFVAITILPVEWRPDLTVTVRWRDSKNSKNDDKDMNVAHVPIEPYADERPDTLYLIFSSNNAIKAYPVKLGPGHPATASELLPPAEICQAIYGCTADFFR